MGDIADMILEGLLDEETGEYIGDINEEDLGTAAPGFPRSIERERRTGLKPWDNEIPEYSLKDLKVNCPICDKLVKVAGIAAHCRDKHNAT